MKSHFIRLPLLPIIIPNIIGAYLPNEILKYSHPFHIKDAIIVKGVLQFQRYIFTLSPY